MDTSAQQMQVLAVILSLDIARLIRHHKADGSVLWIQVATSAEQILGQALCESAGPRESDGILQTARSTLLKYLCARGGATESRAA